MDRPIARTWIVAAVLAASLVMAACGGGDDDGGAGGTTSDGGGTTDGGAATTTVTMVDLSFSPDDPVIAPGDVELVNEDQVTHTFTIDGEDVDVEVAAGETSTATVELDPGSYDLFCRFHRSSGMETTLTVE